MNESWLRDLLGVRYLKVNGGVAFPAADTVDFVGNITGAYDGVNKKIVLTFATTGGTSSFQLKDVCKAATTANVSLSGLSTQDGVPLNADDRVLVPAQTVPSENGIYLVKETAWVRAPDADTSAEWPSSAIVPVDQGTANADSLWRLTTNAPITLGVSPMNFARFDGADARALRGVNINAAAATTNQIYAFDGTNWTAKLITNANIDAAAAIAVSKLATGAEYQTLQVLAGVPTWASLSASNLAENIATAASITTNQNNYSPAGWDLATIVRLNATEVLTPLYLNGLGPATVKRKTVVNPLTTRPFILPNMAGGQAAGNQIRTPTGEDWYLHPGGSVDVFLDVTSGCWVILDLDPLQFQVQQWHDVPVENAVPAHPITAGTFALASGVAVDLSGHALVTMRGENGARASWPLNYWAGTLNAVEVLVGSGDFLGDVAMGGAGAVTLRYRIPNSTGSDFIKGRWIQYSNTQAVPAPNGEYLLSWSGLTHAINPVLGAAAWITAVSGVAPGVMNIHSIRCQVTHTKLKPIP